MNTEVDLLKPITREMADRLLTDKELQDYCAETGMDLGLIVNNLLLTLDQRWAQHQRNYELMMAFKNALPKK